MTPREEQRLEDLIRSFQLEMVQRLTAIETQLKSYDHLRREVDMLKESYNELRGAGKATAVGLTIMQTILASLIILWVNGKIG